MANVPNGGVGTAVITNARLGSLTINKVTSGDDGTFNFTISPIAGTAATASITTVGGNGSVTIYNVNPGTYTITEVPQSGWTGTSSVTTIVPPGGSGHLY